MDIARDLFTAPADMRLALSARKEVRFVEFAEADTGQVYFINPEYVASITGCYLNPNGVWLNLSGGAGVRVVGIPLEVCKKLTDRMKRRKHPRDGKLSLKQLAYEKGHVGYCRAYSGDCPWCAANRFHNKRKRLLKAITELKTYLEGNQ